MDEKGFKKFIETVESAKSRLIKVVTIKRIPLLGDIVDSILTHCKEKEIKEAFKFLSNDKLSKNDMHFPNLSKDSILEKIHNSSKHDWEIYFDEKNPFYDGKNDKEPQYQIRIQFKQNLDIKMIMKLDHHWEGLPEPWFPRTPADCISTTFPKCGYKGCFQKGNNPDKCHENCFRTCNMQILWFYYKDNEIDSMVFLTFDDGRIYLPLPKMLKDENYEKYAKHDDSNFLELWENCYWYLTEKQYEFGAKIDSMLSEYNTYYEYTHQIAQRLKII